VSNVEKSFPWAKLGDCFFDLPGASITIPLQDQRQESLPKYFLMTASAERLIISISHHLIVLL
jgi:hypothetical protein